MRSPSAVLALLLAACAGTPQKPETPPAAEGRDGRHLLIVGINDTHGALLAGAPPRALLAGTKDDIGGADWFAGYLDAIRADSRSRGDEVVILDAGDEFQGTLISNQFRGKSVTEVYNAIGVTASAIGNHEFDFSVPVLVEREAQAKYPMLAANIFYKGTHDRPPWARPSVLVDQGGIKIGIIGLATHETPLTTNPVNVSDLDFPDGAPIAAQEAGALRARGATVVLITAHAGPYPPDREIQHIAEAVQGKVDAIVSGHHHVAIGPPPLIVANIPIVQSGHNLRSFSTIELTLDANNHVKSFAVNEGNLPKSGGPQAILHTWDGAPARWRGRPVQPDAKVAQILAGYDAQVRKLRESRIGEAAVDLRKGGEDDLLANLCADALRSGAGGGLEAQYAFQNAGGLRITEIGKGPVTFGQVFDLVPFDNQQVVVQLTATQVRDALEGVLRAAKGPLRVSGLRYVIDWDRFGAREEGRAAPAGAIVTEVVDARTGRQLCETKSCTKTSCEATCVSGTWSVAMTDFLANGGDGLSMIKGAPKQLGNVLGRDMIVTYVREHSPLTAQFLGAVSSGNPPRWQQRGSPPRLQVE